MRLIDADALELDTEWSEYHDGFISYSWLEINNAPTIEPKRGEWIDKGWKGDWQFETDGRGNCWREYECSECGFHNKGSRSNFCPYCGADMRKGADDE